MVTPRRSTRATNNSADAALSQEESAHISAAVPESVLDDAVNNALISNKDEEEYEEELDIPEQDDGEDYQPEGDADAEDVSLNNDEENESKLKNEDDEDDEDDDEDGKEGDAEEDGDDKDKSDETSGQKRKAPNNSRRQKHSNLNAVNRKRQQSTPVGGEEEPSDGTYPVENDEFVTPDDPKGERKITKLGNLLGGRQFRVKTFKVPGRGDRMYAISTDVARLVGYRDSYFLFQKHIHLFRVRIDEESKMTLINGEFLPGTFKTRAAYLVTARSAYKEFGARIIVDGRQVLDDYYEDQAREDGAIEGAIINPVLSSDGYTNTATDNTTLFERQRNIAMLLSNNNILETETSWVYDHALKCRQFDSMMFYDRNELLKKHVLRDIYTNLNFVPSITQPTCVSIKKLDSDLSESKRKIVFDTVIGGNSIVSTGLACVPAEIYEGCVSDEIKAAILQQQQYERSL